MNVIAVIARYKEDIQWVHKLEIPYLVINKGPVIDDEIITKNSVNIPNDVNGRESHSYFWYIINHYDSLPEKVIFLQGDPFTHQPDILDILKADTIQNIPDLVGLTRYYVPNHPSQNIREIRGRYMVNNVECWKGYMDDILNPVFPLFNDKWFSNNSVNDFKQYIQEYHPSISTDCSNKELVFKFHDIPYEPDHMSPYFFSALMSVDKKHILSRSPEYYKRMLHYTTEKICSGYIVERIWIGIFSGKMNYTIDELRQTKN